MIKLFVKRTVVAIVQIFMVASVVFLIMHSMPGNPARLMLEVNGTQATEAQVLALEKQMGLDLPLADQYSAWIKGLFSLQLGDSFYHKQPVSQFIMQRLSATVELALAAIALAVIAGVLVGIVSAQCRGKMLDYLVTTTTVLGISLPNYVVATLLIFVFAVSLQVLPSGGYKNFLRDPVSHLRYLILPAMTLALGISAAIARITRSTLLEESGKEYVLTLRAKGQKSAAILYRHVLKNALIPIVTVIGLQLGTLIGGAVVIENIFNWPGLSTLVVEAVSHRDYPMIQACVVVIAAIYIIINTVLDLLYLKLDPRTRKGAGI